MRRAGERPRTTRMKGDDASGERIEIPRLETCRKNGRDNSDVATQHPLVLDDPNLRGIMAGGVQAGLATILTFLEQLEETSHRLTDAARRHARLHAETTRAARDHAAAIRALEEHRQHLHRANRFPLLPEAPGWLVIVLLGMIALAEWQLNRGPLEVVVDDATGADVLALMVGVGQVTAAHLAGLAWRRLLDRREDWTGRITAIHYLLMLSTMLGMAVSALALHQLREYYLAGTDGHGPLMALQVFLLWTASLLSLAHDNPMRLEDRRLERVAHDREVRVGKLLDELENASNRYTRARAARRSVLAELVDRVEIQDQHTKRAGYEFLAGVQAAASDPVTAELDTQAYVQREAWLTELKELAQHREGLSQSLLDLLQGDADVPPAADDTSAGADNSVGAAPAATADLDDRRERPAAEPSGEGQARASETLEATSPSVNGSGSPSEGER